MICTKCGAEVPAGQGYKKDNQLVCTCFLVHADNEIETRALKLFSDGRPLWLTNAPSSGHHIMPNPANCLTLCHKKRLGHPETRGISGLDVANKAAEMKAGKKPDWCVECLLKAQSANTEPVHSVPGIPGKKA